MSPAGKGFVAHALVPTRRAHRYLHGLAERWRGKAAVVLAEGAARIDLPAGPCFLSAGPGSLALLVEADEAARLADLQWTIGSRLERLGRAEGLRVVWSSPAGLDAPLLILRPPAETSRASARAPHDPGGETQPGW